jgi:ribosomal protein S18 acetylase RimI-like enzyme
MIIRDFEKNDTESVEVIFALYWTDPLFLNELSDKLQMAVNNTSECHEQKLKFFVAVEGDEIIGIGGLINAPDYLREHAETDTPAELYILASKYKGKGIGSALREKIIEEAKKLGFTEVLLYSPNSHQESWSFYDKFGSERIGEIVAPDGEPGQVWRKLL